MIKTGADIISQNPKLLPAGKYAVLCHLASTTSNLIHILQILKHIPHIKVELVLAPEHGFYAAAQDQIAVNSEKRDPFCNAPIISLYGEEESTLAPKQEHLEGIDFVLADLFDIGSRYYTFAATAAYTMKTCSKAGIPFIVLDRPNPLGGKIVEGPPMNDKFRSFVGAFKYTQIRHGMTIAELIKYYVITEGLDYSNIKVIKTEEWNVETLFNSTKLPWTYPSPNMPTFQTAIVYPGACLLEGTQLSEGRGTTKPFEQFGAPLLDPSKIINNVNKRHISGAKLRPIWFTPKFHKHKNKLCSGIEVIVTDPRKFSAINTYIELISTIRHTHGADACRWREGTYEFVSDRLSIDLLLGDYKWREAIENGEPVDEQIRMWDNSEETKLFTEYRKQSLMYSR